METSRPVILFPFIAQGHIIPFMRFSELIVQRTRLSVIIVNTPLNIQRLKTNLSPSSNIRLKSLDFKGSEHELPPGSENTNLVSLQRISSLIVASESLRPSFESLVEEISCHNNAPPLCIIADLFLGWTVEVARRFNIYHAVLATCGVLGTAAFISAWLNLPHMKTKEENLTLPGFPSTFLIHRSQLSVHVREANGADVLSVFFQRQIQFCFQSDGMICNSIEEMEQRWVPVLKQIIKIPVWFIGPLLPLFLLQDQHWFYPSAPQEYTARLRKKPSGSLAYCLEWLDQQQPSSVLYVCFGSENTLRASQMRGLAAGLEATSQPFIWVIRPPLGEDITSGLSGQGLPEGFEERLSKEKKGLLVRDWAPQMEILSHPSTGGFLSHCGWNSVLESISQGVPIIGWPVGADQFTNCKLLEGELGVAVELARGFDDDVNSERVQIAIETVMCGSTEAMKLKWNVERVRRMFRDAMSLNSNGRMGSSVVALEDFLCIVSSICSKRDKE